MRSPVLYTILILISLLNFSCTERMGQDKSEGFIHFKVTFPYNSDDLITELYPKEMVLAFSGNRMHSKLSSVGGLVSTEFIIDNNKREFHQLLKSFNEKYAMKLDESGTQQWLSRQEKFRFEETPEAKSIAGFECKKTIAYFMNDSLPPINLFHTDQVNIESANWWSQFAPVNGVLMEYEVEQYGLRMRLEATKVLFEEVPEEQFLPATGYRQVSMDEMDKHIRSLMASGS